MRISTALLFQRGASAIQDKSAELSRAQQYIAAGKKVLRPSDDPAGAARILDLNAFIDTAEQYQRNIGMLKSRLELQESTLNGVTDVLQRAHELAVQGNNDTVGPEGRAAIADEIDVLNDQLMSLANTRDANDEYLFAGSKRNTPPFTRSGGALRYQGDQTRRELRIAADRQVGDAATGFEVFMKVPASGGGNQNVFTTLDKLSADLRADNKVSVHIDDIQLALDKVLGIRTRDGAGLNTAIAQQDVNEGFLVSMKARLSEAEDLDYAEALTGFQQDLLALQAAQQSFVKIQGLSLFNYL